MNAFGFASIVAVMSLAGADLLNAPIACAISDVAITHDASRSLVRSVLVSGADQFSGCTQARFGRDLHPHSYSRTAVEPTVAINPRATQNVIGVWQQDRWSGGGARGLVASSSMDGGLTWSTGRLPFGLCASSESPYDRVTDPSLSIGPDGTAYATGLGVTYTQRANGKVPQKQSTGVVAVTSSDGGRSWGNSQTIAADTDTTMFNNNEWVTADPGKPGVAYVVWTRDNSALPGSTIEFATTADGGKRWSVPQAIVTRPRDTYFNNQIVVDPRSGTLYDFFRGGASGQPPDTIDFVRSNDGGVTWSTPAAVSDIRTLDIRAPVTKLTVRARDNLSVAIDARTGALYVVWTDSRFASSFPYHDDIAMTRSLDGGDHWTTPTRVNRSGKKAAFNPTVAVNGSGVVAVSYYDFRSSVARNKGVTTAYWITVSLTMGRTFGPERQLDSFNLNTAPVTESGYFLGDYEGLASERTQFLPVWSRSSRSSTDIRAAKIAP